MRDANWRRRNSQTTTHTHTQDSSGVVSRETFKPFSLALIMIINLLQFNLMCIFYCQPHRAEVRTKVIFRQCFMSSLHLRLSIVCTHPLYLDSRRRRTPKLMPIKFEYFCARERTIFVAAAWIVLNNLNHFWEHSFYLRRHRHQATNIQRLLNEGPSSKERTNFGSQKKYLNMSFFLLCFGVDDPRSRWISLIFAPSALPPIAI